MQLQQAEKPTKSCKIKTPCWNCVDEIINEPGLLGCFREKANNGYMLCKIFKILPVLLIDKKEQNVFYKGVNLCLPPTAFKLLLFMAERAGEVCLRKEIYNTMSDDIYEHQITDHKRVIIQCLKNMKKRNGKQLTDNEVKKFITTKTRLGYILNIPKSEVRIIG